MTAAVPHIRKYTVGQPMTATVLHIRTYTNLLQPKSSCKLSNAFSKLTNSDFHTAINAGFYLH